MQNFHLLVAGAVVFSAVTGASLATVFRQSTPEEQTLVQASPIQPQASQEQEAPSSPSAVTKPNRENSIKTTLPAQPKQEVVASTAKLDDFPHQRIRLTDEVKPGSEFAQFRQRLRQAIRDRNAQFVRSILPVKAIGIGFGSAEVANLKLEDPNEDFWSLLEKAVSIGCYSEANEGRPNIDPGTEIWVCNNATREFYRQYPNPNSEPGLEYELNHVVIVGDNVNVRQEPNANSRVVGWLSNEVVKVNRPIEEQRAKERADQRRAYDPLNDWIAVILPNKQLGYVSSRYGYSPLEYRAVFGRVDDQWQLLHLPGGD
ncbi:MAG: SH3 domain-containing protein [Microcoleus sp. SIO2G3]|nr:SH3 domain-containing protein [Microcoleus sp. SIO2G3]